MSVVFVTAQDSESFVIGKDEKIPVGNNLSCVVVTAGQVKATDSTGRECKVSDWTCTDPAFLTGLEDDTEVMLCYGPKKPAPDLARRLVEALHAFQGLPICLECRKVLHEGIVDSFEVSHFNIGNKQYPRISVNIATDSGVLTHEVFTRRFTNRLSFKPKRRFWKYAWIKFNGEWLSLDKLVPQNVRSFRDTAAVESCIETLKEFKPSYGHP